MTTYSIILTLIFLTIIGIILVETIIRVLKWTGKIILFFLCLGIFVWVNNNNTTKSSQQPTEIVIQLPPSDSNEITEGKKKINVKPQKEKAIPTQLGVSKISNVKGKGKGNKDIVVIVIK